MKKYLLAAALVGAFSLPAQAQYLPPSNAFVYDSYSLPDPYGFNTFTTTADGVPYPPYSYYTGPIILHLTGGGTVNVYSNDLNHIFAGSGTYFPRALTTNGAGQALGGK